MKAALDNAVRRLRAELGLAGLASLALLGAAALFLVLALRPLEERARLLEARLAQAEGSASPKGGPKERLSGASARLSAFYSFFDTGQQPAEWLGRLHAIARQSGVELRSADYRMQRAGGRIERYEIALPLTATYPQLRAFLRAALAEIPVLSLDQVAIKRQRAGDGNVQADVHMTLHMVKP